MCNCKLSASGMHAAELCSSPGSGGGSELPLAGSDGTVIDRDNIHRTRHGTAAHN